MLMMAKFSASDESHDKVYSLLSLEHIAHIHKEWVIRHIQYIPLIAQKLCHTLLNNLCLAYSFHCKYLVRIFLFDKINFTVSSFTDDLYFLKVCVGN